MSSKNYVDDSDTESEKKYEEALEKSFSSQSLDQKILIADKESSKDNEELSSSSVLPHSEASMLLPEKMKMLSLKDISSKVSEKFCGEQTSDVQSEKPTVKSDIQSINVFADKQLEEMIEMAEKAVVILSLHFNDCCEGRVEAERARIAVIGLHEVITFIDSLSMEKKVILFNELLTKPIFVEMLGAYFMKHWTGMYVEA